MYIKQLDIFWSFLDSIYNNIGFYCKDADLLFHDNTSWERAMLDGHHHRQVNHPDNTNCFVIASKTYANISIMCVLQTVFTAIGLGGCVICTVTVRWVGKRPLALTSVIGCAVSSIAVGVYSLYVPEAERQNHSSSWLPMLCMVAWAFFTGVGMDPLPWMYLSEVFPFR